MNRQENIIDTMKSLGFDTEGKSFLRNVELLLAEHIRLMQEIEQDNKEFFRKELNRVATNPSN